MKGMKSNMSNIEGKVVILTPIFLQALSAASYWKRQVILSPKQA